MQGDATRERRPDRRGHVRSYVAPGLPGYRPVRSPLVSMGPSLVDERRRRSRIVALLLVAGAVAIVAAGVFWVVAFVDRQTKPRWESAAPRARLALATQRPEPLTLVRVAGLQLQMPIHHKGVTAIGYERISEPLALPLEPEGTAANVSGVSRLLRRFLATEAPGKLRYFLLDESGEPNVVAVGAPAGAAVYAPVSGTIMTISDNIIDGEAHGVVLQIQPLGDAETVVVLRNLDSSKGLAPGQTVSQGATLLGHVRSMAAVQEQPLAQYTADRGDALEMHVRRVQADQPIG